jgi:hypothetical protein
MLQIIERLTLLMMMLLLYAAPTTTSRLIPSSRRDPARSSRKGRVSAILSDLLLRFFHPFVDGEGHIDSVHIVPREQVRHGLAVDVPEVPYRTVPCCRLFVDIELSINKYSISFLAFIVFSRCEEFAEICSTLNFSASSRFCKAKKKKKKETQDAECNPNSDP